MDKETAHYIVTYYFNLMPEAEKLAWKHYSSILKLEDNDNPKVLEIYKRKGWITDDYKILELLEKGYDHFEKKTAIKIFEKNSDQIFLNRCSKCKKLARTPLAKQCRSCGYSWHLNQ